MRTKGSTLLLGLSLLASVATAGPAAASSWEVSLAPGGNPTSIQDLELAGPGQLWAVGGLADPTLTSIAVA